MSRITNFHGLMSNVEELDVPAGAAQSQDNVTTVTPGVLRARKGIQDPGLTSPTTIGSGYNTFQPFSFAKSRDGDLIAVNGVDRGWLWDGVSAAVVDLGITAPDVAPTVTTENILSISNVTDNGGEYQITTSSSHGLTTGDIVRIAGITATGGMDTALNGESFTITNQTATTFTLDGTSFTGTYTSGGRVAPPDEGATAGNYVVGYRWVDDDGPITKYSSLSPLATVTANEGEAFDWDTIPNSGESRVTKLELFRSTSGVTNVLYKIATIDDGDTSYTGPLDVNDDNTLNQSSDDDTLLVLRDPPADTTLVARRFTPPPDDKPYVVMFQDRFWYGGEVRYNRGSVATNGTTTLTGTGTDWTIEMVGRYVDISGESESFEITGFTSATQLTLATAASTTASSLDYVIFPDPAEKRKLRYSEPDEPESVPVVNTVTIQEATGDDDAVTGLMPHGSYLYILTDHHKYALSFARQPNVDAAVRYVDDRGAFNHRCWGIFEKMAYIMDDAGVYAFDGQASHPISQPIQDIWRQDGGFGSIDFAKSGKFHLRVDRAQEKVYCFVSFVGDTDERPTRSLVYNIRRKTWDPMTYPQQIGASTTTTKLGESVVFVGAEDQAVYQLDVGTTDVVTSLTEGTVDSASTTEITDNDASFVSGMVGAPIYIVSGTGKGQESVISSVDSGTSITVSPAFSTAPSSDSTYAIGAIGYSLRLKNFTLRVDEDRDKRELEVAFQPTTSDRKMDARFYYNRDSSPEEMDAQQDLGDNVVIEDDNKTDVVFHLKSDHSDLQDSIGRESFRFDGQSNNAAYGDREVSIELRGASGDDQVEVNEINIEGVE